MSKVDRVNEVSHVDLRGITDFLALRRNTSLLLIALVLVLTGSLAQPALKSSSTLKEQRVLLALYLHFFVSALKSMERVKGIEPSFLFLNRLISALTF